MIQYLKEKKPEFALHAKQQENAHGNRGREEAEGGEGALRLTPTVTNARQKTDRGDGTV